MLISFSVDSFAQIWAKTLGGSGTDLILDVYQKSDGTFVAGGSTASFQDPSFYDAYLVKLDSSGNIVWQKSYGEISTSESFYSIRTTSDGGYIAAGVAYSSSPGSAGDVYVAKVNNLGTLQWKKRWTIQSDSDEQIRTVRQTQDGGYILGGFVYMPISIGDVAGLVVKLDSSGNLVWHNRYEVDFGSPDSRAGAFTYLDATSDGGAIVAGWLNDSNARHLWIVKIASSGTVTWQKQYNNNIGGTENIQIRQISGGYALFVSDGATGFWFLKLDESGNILVNRLFAGPDPFNPPIIFAMDQSPNGNYFLGGVAADSLDQYPLIVKLDSSANLSWSKISTGNGEGWEASLSKTSDNGLVFGGVFRNTCNDDEDFWVVRLDSNGNSCEFAGSGNIILQPQPTVSSFSLPTTIVSAGLVAVTSNAIASNTNATLRDQCSAGMRALTECSLFFHIIDQACGTNQACIDERKVLISKTSTLDDYPSQFQRDVAPPKDRKILIKGSVTDSLGNPISNRTVYLRVLDPADSAPYITPPTPGDNIDKDPSSPGGTGGKLDDYDPITGSNGELQTVLNVISSKKCTAQNGIDCYPSGDNYQIEGSFTQDFSCSPNCIKTGVITTWKRIYIERDKMFRMGGLLAQNAIQNQTSILVKGATARLCPGDPPPAPSACCDSNPSGNACYQIALFDAVNTYEASGSEQPWVDYIVPVGQDWRLHLATSQNGNTPYSIQKSMYAYSDYPTFVAFGASPHGKSAGIGIIGSGLYELSTNTDLIETAFKDAFVETKTTSTQIGAIPHLPKSFFDLLSSPTGQLPVLRFAKLWFNNCFSGSDYLCDPNNFLHVLGIIGETQTFVTGRTQSVNNSSFIHIANIETICPTCNQENFKQHSTAHELAHQFSVNFCSGTTQEHDLQPAWCSNEALKSYCGNRTDINCIMKIGGTDQASDGIERFDVNDLFFATCAFQPPDSIRKALDPK